MNVSIRPKRKYRRFGKLPRSVHVNEVSSLEQISPYVVRRDCLAPYLV
ncbi:hypothetical protein TIFTF001_042422, partial [Ficus carica]